jgi:hypothetical protein
MKYLLLLTLLLVGCNETGQLMPDYEPGLPVVLYGTPAKFHHVLDAKEEFGLGSEKFDEALMDGCIAHNGDEVIILERLVNTDYHGRTIHMSRIRSGDCEGYTKHRNVRSDG